MEEHLISFIKMVSRTMLIIMLLHPVLSHGHIILECVENFSSRCEGFINLLQLIDPWRIRWMGDFGHIHPQRESFEGHHDKFYYTTIRLEGTIRPIRIVSLH
jgi:hypothetical protein